MLRHILQQDALKSSLSCHKAEVKRGCVSLNELSMSVAEAPELSPLVTPEKKEGQKQWKAFIFLSPNLLQLYVRVQARAGGGAGAGERIAGAMAGCSMVAFFLFDGDALTHSHTQIRRATPGDSPQE